MADADLFETVQSDGALQSGRRPLAARMRPERLEDIVGQDHILGPGKLLRRAIEADRLSSLILYGPPGCGKTTLAEVIARVTRRRFERTSGVMADVAVLRGLLRAAQHRREADRSETILFIDEIHRFNKAQQDVLLPYVEDGTVTLIGATTHNPFFFINSPLTSRSQIFELEPLSEAAVAAILARALAQDPALAARRAGADAEALAHLARVCDGDARRALNALEIAVLTTPPDADGAVRITVAAAEESIQKRAVRYDRDEDGHYDTISAFIKSVRGCDANAALYWLAKMLYAGEDPRFVARRMMILASEDVGNADPRALTVAVSAFQASECVGMPEARIILAQAAAYLATAPKSNAACAGIDRAWADVENGKVLPVPRHLRGAGYRGADRLGHKGYAYSHDAPDGVTGQVYAPTTAVYYEPRKSGYEETIQQRMAHWDALRQERRREAAAGAQAGGGDG